MIEIGNERLRATVDAQRGGCVLGLEALGPQGPIALLRGAGDSFAKTGDPTLSAAFVTAPHFGPVRGGTLTWEGQQWPILRNHPDEPEPIHGDAWLRPWDVTARSADAVSLAYSHVPAPGSFPAPYRISQNLRIEDTALHVRLSLHNLADVPILAGMAWHPYFPLQADTMLDLAAKALWSRHPLEDARPFGPVPDLFRFAPPRHWGGLVADDTYEEWDGSVTIRQPGYSLRMEAGAPFSKLQVFAPDGEDYICIEPASNAPNARRLAEAGVENHGLVSLPPGDALEGTVSLSFEVHG